MKLTEMSLDERSLLLYFESRSVDHGGKVDIRHMNQLDMDIADRWNKSRFILFGRIVIRHHINGVTNWCRLSDSAWKLAHKERRERHTRLWLKKDWLTTEDNIAVHGNPHFSGMNRRP